MSNGDEAREEPSGPDASDALRRVKALEEKLQSPWRIEVGAFLIATLSFLGSTYIGLEQLRGGTSELGFQRIQEAQRQVAEAQGWLAGDGAGTGPPIAPSFAALCPPSPEFYIKARAARAAITRALELEPDYAPAWELLAQVAERDSTLDEAIDQAVSALREEELSPSTLAGIAHLFSLADDFGRAEQVLSRASALESDNPDVLAQRLQLELDRGNSGEALKIARHMLSPSVKDGRHLADGDLVLPLIVVGQLGKALEVHVKSGEVSGYDESYTRGLIMLQFLMREFDVASVNIDEAIERFESPDMFAFASVDSFVWYDYEEAHRRLQQYSDLCRHFDFAQHLADISGAALAANRGDCGAAMGVDGFSSKQRQPLLLEQTTVYLSRLAFYGALSTDDPFHSLSHLTSQERRTISKFFLEPEERWLLEFILAAHRYELYPSIASAFNLRAVYEDAPPLLELSGTSPLFLFAMLDPLRGIAPSAQPSGEEILLLREAVEGVTNWANSTAKDACRWVGFEILDEVSMVLRQALFVWSRVYAPTLDHSDIDAFYTLQ